MNRLIFQELKQPEEVLARYEVCSTNCVETASQWGEKILCKNDLSIIGTASSKPGFNTNIYFRQLSDIGFGRMSYGGDVVIKPRVFEDFVFIQMPVRGEERIILDDVRTVNNPDTALVVNRHSKSLFNHSQGTEKLFLRIQQEAIQSHARKILGRATIDNIFFSPFMDLNSQAGKQWVRVLSWAYDFLSEDWDLSPIMLAQIESNIINTLLLSQSNNYSDYLLSDAPGLTPFFVKRVESYIEENAHLPITIDDLAEFSGVSARSLFSGFKKYRDTTPMRYLKDVRLQYVYEELSGKARVDDTVTDIALKWGFGHLGHFGVDYKKRFGEAPSMTLRRARG